MRAWEDISPHHRACYKPCPGCGGPAARHALACRNCSTALPRGESHYAWKGDAARETTKRERARALYELGPCERCGKQGTDRHHKDANTGNNVPENIAILCRRCHMEVDGRLSRLIAMNQTTPAACGNCGRIAKLSRSDRCQTCMQYKRRNGVERPARLYERAA